MDEVSEFLRAARIDLGAKLLSKRDSWEASPSVRGRELLLIARLFKRRTDDGLFESFDSIAFHVPRTASEVGGDLGLWSDPPPDKLTLESLRAAGPVVHCYQVIPPSRRGWRHAVPAIARTGAAASRSAGVRLARRS